MSDPIMLAVVVFDFSAAAHIGGSGETIVRTFELPPDALEYITEMRKGTYSTVTLAIHEQARGGE